MLTWLIDHGFDFRFLGSQQSGILDCFVESAGLEHRRQEPYRLHGLQRGSTPTVLIQHTLVGEGRLSYAGERLNILPGRTMVLAAPHDHSYWLERGRQWEYFYLLLEGREALRLGRSLLDRTGPVMTLPPNLLDRLAECCLKALDRNNTQPGFLSAIAYTALTTLFDSIPNDNEVLTAVKSPQIARVLNYISANLHENLGVDKLSSVAAISRSHFVRIFTATMDISPSNYVLVQRLERVERLLLASDLTVSRIAEMTGFSSSNYLAKVFQNHAGETPSQFRLRRQHWPDQVG